MFIDLLVFSSVVWRTQRIIIFSTDTMTRVTHDNTAVAITDAHEDHTNADVNETATCGEADQTLSDIKSENMGTRQKPVSSQYIIFLEPIVFVYALYLGAVFPLLDQFVRARISNDYNSSSQHINNSNDILSGCDNKSSLYRNSEIDSEASLWTLYMTIASLLPAVVSLWMLGSYSDKGGRKVAIIIPQIGALIRCITLLAVIYFDLPLYVMVIGAFFEGLSGAFHMFLSAGFSCVADITSPEMRSLRITVLDGCFTFGTVVSQIACGYLIASLGFFYPFLILAVILLLDIVATIILLPETVTKDPDVRFWSFGHLRNAFNVYSRDNGTGRRWKLLMCLAIVFLTCSVTYAGYDVKIFYLLDVPFCFSSVMIGYFNAMLMLISGPVSILMTKLTLSVFGDTGLLLIGAVSGTAYLGVVTFSTTILVLIGKFCCFLQFVLQYQKLTRQTTDLYELVNTYSGVVYLMMAGNGICSQNIWCNMSILGEPRCTFYASLERVQIDIWESFNRLQNVVTNTFSTRRTHAYIRHNATHEV